MHQKGKDVEFSRRAYWRYVFDVTDFNQGMPFEGEVLSDVT